MQFSGKNTLLFGHYLNLGYSVNTRLVHVVEKERADNAAALGRLHADLEPSVEEGLFGVQLPSPVRSPTLSCCGFQHQQH